MKIRFDAVWRKNDETNIVLLLTLMLILTASVAVAHLGEPGADFTVVNEELARLTALSGLLQTEKSSAPAFFCGLAG